MVPTNDAEKLTRMTTLKVPHKVSSLSPTPSYLLTNASQEVPALQPPPGPLPEGYFPFFMPPPGYFPEGAQPHGTPPFFPYHQFPPFGFPGGMHMPYPHPMQPPPPGPPHESEQPDPSMLEPVPATTRKAKKRSREDGSPAKTTAAKKLKASGGEASGSSSDQV